MLDDVQFPKHVRTSDRIIMQLWQCPLLLMVSLIAAINTQQTPSQQRFEPNQVAELVELHQQLGPSREQQEQPAQADNKVL